MKPTRKFKLPAGHEWLPSFTICNSPMLLPGYDMSLCDTADTYVLTYCCWLMTFSEVEMKILLLEKNLQLSQLCWDFKATLPLHELIILTKSYIKIGQKWCIESSYLMLYESGPSLGYSQDGCKVFQSLKISPPPQVKCTVFTTLHSFSTRLIL